jgi:hypothetical protein
MTVHIRTQPLLSTLESHPWVLVLFAVGVVLLVVAQAVRKGIPQFLLLLATIAAFGGAVILALNA